VGSTLFFFNFIQILAIFNVDFEIKYGIWITQEFKKMKAVEISLIKSLDQSFVFYHERNPFSRWHYHPEYELVLINKGIGKRMVGDSIDRFDEGDLVFLGSNLPHEWLCDESFYTKEGFLGEGIVIHFREDFLGGYFFKTPENKRLLKLLEESAQGCLLKGETKQKITDLMLRMTIEDTESKFYTLFEIFKLLTNSNEYDLLSSPNFTTTFQSQNSQGLQKVIEFIMQNFQKKIQMKDLLDIANMSSTTFSVFFKKNYNMTFSEYLLKVRIGYACNLLTDSSRSISQISFDAGFENLSNFNRLFKKAKGITPKEFRKKAIESEKFSSFYA
jgi:AraC-like DNA-binding protein